MLWAVLALMLVTACTESELSHDASGGLEEIAAEAEEIFTAFPPLCEALRTQGYETRKATFDDADETALDLAQNACPGDIAQLDAARQVEEATARVTPDDIAVEFTRCAGTTTGFEASATFTNNGPETVGIFAAIRAEKAQQLSGRAAFVVIWRLDPGESATRDVEGDASGDGCGAQFTVYLADPDLTGDASGVDPANEAIASDDPAVFYPALYETEQKWWTNTDASIDGPSRTEDLRSAAYRPLVDSVVAGEKRPALDTMRGLCSSRPHPDNPDLMILTVHLGDQIRSGIVRRGADGGWRWVGSLVVRGPGPCP